MTLVEKARVFAREAHKGQFRRDGITPYFNHCEKVASLVDTDLEKSIAYCHDLLEDLRCSYEDLADNVSEEVASICNILDKKDLSYFEYIKIQKNSGLSITIKIKIADIVANLSDNPSEKQVLKYNKALRILTGVEK